MNRIYFVRHGENLANLTKELSHRLVDYSLTPKGILQARQTAQFFEDKNIHEIYASPLKRAVETAEIIASTLQLKVTVLENFREVNVGDLELPPASAEKWVEHNRIVEAWFQGQPQTRFPGGEDYFSLLARMRAGIRQITAGKAGRNLIVVGHGGIFTYTLNDLCGGIDLDLLQRVENHNCSITEVLFEEKDGQLHGALVSWASHSHLRGQAAELVSGFVR